MEDEDTHGKKMARKGRTEVIYKGTFVSERSLLNLQYTSFSLGLELKLLFVEGNSCYFNLRNNTKVVQTKAF